MTGRASRRLRLSSSPARVRPWTKPASRAVGTASAPPRYDVVSPPNALSRPLPSLLPTNYILRNDDRSRHQESERHRVIVWGMHAEKVARLLRKGSKIRVQGRMTYPTWKDKQTGATRYGAEIVAQTLDYQGANAEDEMQIERSEER